MYKKFLNFLRKSSCDNFVIFLLLNRTLPLLGLIDPEIRLNNVVLPEPFGPIIPVIIPLIFNEQFFTAERHQNFLII